MKKWGEGFDWGTLGTLLGHCPISSLKKLAFFEDDDFSQLPFRWDMLASLGGYTRYHRIMSPQPPHHGGSPRQLHSYHRGASCQRLYPRRRAWPTQGVMETRALVSYLWLTNHISHHMLHASSQPPQWTLILLFFLFFLWIFQLPWPKTTKNKRSRTYSWSQSFMSHTKTLEIVLM